MRRGVLAVLMVAALTGPAVARAEGLDQTCELTATRFDADATNILFPDSSAQYWSAHLPDYLGYYAKTLCRIAAACPRQQ